jgi:hypothetical protein
VQGPYEVNWWVACLRPLGHNVGDSVCCKVGNVCVTFNRHSALSLILFVSIEFTQEPYDVR